MWIYNETDDFIKSADKIDLSDQVRESIRQWAKDLRRTQTNKTKLYFRSPSQVFEIWTARIPDPESNRGASGGFRLTYFFVLNELAVHMGQIEYRKKVGFKKERPKDKQRYEKYLRELKNYLMHELET